MIDILYKIPAYIFFRKFNIPKILPLSLAISLTYRCNSRCKTCNIYKKKADELTLSEYEKIFKSIGKTPLWFTLSGGEPFIREDINKICQMIYEYCRPKIINIATNGILSDKIIKDVSCILKSCPDLKLIINLSIDEIGSRHDEIRGVKDNFKYVINTFHALKNLNSKNLIVGIHTVISRYNVKNFSNIFDYIISLKPDSYIVEIAQERVELDTVGTYIAPTKEEYISAINILSNSIKKQRYSGLVKLIQLFRLEYYELTKHILIENRKFITCYAGFASAQIMPDGKVWACCIKGDSLGNLRETDYDFRWVWFSDVADRIRDSIKKRGCFCTSAAIFYTNMLFNLQTMTRTGLRFIDVL